MFTTGAQGLGYYREKAPAPQPSSRRGRGGDAVTTGASAAAVSIHAGHLFDRLVASHLLLTSSSAAALPQTQPESQSQSVHSSSGSSSSSSSGSSSSNIGDNSSNIDNDDMGGGPVDMKSAPVSVAFLLVALNMAERTGPHTSTASF